MFAWLNKKIEAIGDVFFPGTLPPRPEEFADLQKLGIEVTPRTDFDPKRAHWALHLRHPQWGEVDCAAFREKFVEIEPLLQFDFRLSRGEIAEALRAQSVVSLRMLSPKGNVLRDRKHFLRFLRAVMGDDGLLVMLNTTHGFWSRAQLDDELAHDADLDITGIYSEHAVGDKSLDWLHTHGLAAAGAFDFDIISPDRSLLDHAADIRRALAFAVLEGTLRANGPAIQIADPLTEIQAVTVDRFHREAPEAQRQLREQDESHSDQRVVICEPAKRGWFGFGRTGVRAARHFCKPIPDQFVCHFSFEATELMRRRARATYDYFRALHDEFKQIELPALVKLGYQVDGGKEDECEHLWFHVHEAGDNEVDATLENEPFNIERMQRGQRDHHPIDRLTEWVIMTPAGPITPFNTAPARKLRENWDKLLAAFTQHREQSGGA